MSGQGTERQANDPSVWKARSETYAKLGWVNLEKPLVELVDFAAIRNGQVIADLGTGSGAVLEAILKIHPNEDLSLFGFDISNDMLEVARSRLNGQVHFQTADATTIPSNDDTFDLVTARMVYHHVENPVAAVTEAKRILRPGGTLIVGEHYATSDQVKAFERRFFEIKEPGRHIWTLKELKGLLISGGFTHIEARTGVVEQYSLTEWLLNNGITGEMANKILTVFRETHDQIKVELNITEDGEDVLMDGHYSYVRGEKG